MITLVSGFMRSGTSMMMQALEAGGMTCAYHPIRDTMNTTYGDAYYPINEGGFYELTPMQYQDPIFPDPYDGQVVKLLWGGMPLLKSSITEKRIIFMRRPMIDIADSYEAAFGHPCPTALPEMSEKLDRIVGILQQRRDVTLVELHYYDVLGSPQETFHQLAQWGLPIDSSAAAAQVDPTRCRHGHSHPSYG